MIIIADSGSTKTTWMEVETGNMTVTEGLNPHFTSDAQFLKACKAVNQLCRPNGSVLSVYFYGAGCGNPTQNERVVKLLNLGFCTSDIHVGTDMLGACLAVSGNRKSIVAILGTGSNTCYYDGEKIVWQPTSTGFILGDYGSANHVGRILLNDYLTQRMPDETRMLFHNRFQMTNDQFIDAVYHRPNPNRFLASLAPFAVENSNIEHCTIAENRVNKYQEKEENRVNKYQDKEENRVDKSQDKEENLVSEYCSNVILTALNDWYQGPLETIIKHTNYKKGEINIVGGFAKAIEKEIQAFFKDKELSVNKIIANPIEGMREYHKTANGLS